MIENINFVCQIVAGPSGKHRETEAKETAKGSPWQVKKCKKQRTSHRVITKCSLLVARVGHLLLTGG